MKYMTNTLCVAFIALLALTVIYAQSGRQVLVLPKDFSVLGSDYASDADAIFARDGKLYLAKDSVMTWEKGTAMPLGSFRDLKLNAFAVDQTNMPWVAFTVDKPKVRQMMARWDGKKWISMGDTPPINAESLGRGHLVERKNGWFYIAEVDAGCAPGSCRGLRISSYDGKKWLAVPNIRTKLDNQSTWRAAVVDNSDQLFVAVETSFKDIAAENQYPNYSCNEFGIYKFNNKTWQLTQKFSCLPTSKILIEQTSEILLEKDSKGQLYMAQMINNQLLLRKWNGETWASLGKISVPRYFADGAYTELSLAIDAKGNAFMGIISKQESSRVAILIMREANGTWKSTRVSNSWLRVARAGANVKAVWQQDGQIIVDEALNVVKKPQSAPPTPKPVANNPASVAPTPVTGSSNQINKGFLGFWSDGFSLEWTITQNGKIFELAIPGVTKIPVQIDKSWLVGNLNFGQYDDYNLRGPVLCKLVSNVLLQCAISNRQNINMTRQSSTQLTQLPRVPSLVEFKQSLVNQKLVTKRGEYISYFIIDDINQIKTFRLMPNINVNRNYGTMQVAAEIILNDGVQQVRGIVAIRYSVRDGAWNLVEFSSIENNGYRFAMEFKLLDSKNLNYLIPFTNWVVQAFDFGVAKGYGYNVTEFSSNYDLDDEKIWNCRDGKIVRNETNAIIVNIPKAGKNITTCQFFRSGNSYDTIATDTLGSIYACLTYENKCISKESMLGDIFGDYQDIDNPENVLTISPEVFDTRLVISIGSGAKKESISVKGRIIENDQQYNIYSMQFCTIKYECNGFYLHKIFIQPDIESHSFELYNEDTGSRSYYMRKSNTPESMQVKIVDSAIRHELQAGEAKKFQVQILGVPTKDVQLSANVIDNTAKGLNLTLSKINGVKSTLEIVVPNTVEIGYHSIKVVAKLGEITREAIVNITILPNATQKVPVGGNLSMNGTNFRIFESSGRKYYVAEDWRTNLYIKDIQHKGTDGDGNIKLEYTIINLGNTDGLLEAYDVNGKLVELYPVGHFEGSKDFVEGVDDYFREAPSSFSALWNGFIAGKTLEYLGDPTLNDRYKQAPITVTVPKGGKIVLTKTSDAARAWNTTLALFNFLALGKKLVDPLVGSPDKQISNTKRKQILSSIKEMLKYLAEEIVAKTPKDLAYEEFFKFTKSIFSGEIASLLNKGSIDIATVTTLLDSLQDVFENLYSELKTNLVEAGVDLAKDAAIASINTGFSSFLRVFNPTLSLTFDFVTDLNALMYALLWAKDTASMNVLSEELRSEGTTDKSEMILFNN